MAEKIRGKLKSIYGGRAAAGRDRLPLSELKGMTPKQHCQQEIKKSSGKGYFKQYSPGEDVCMLPGGYFSGGNLEAVFSYYYDTYEKIELKSETKAILPQNRGRTTIGLGEAVTVYSNTPVFWQADTRLINTSIPKEPSSLFTFIARDKAGSVTIKAKHDYDEKSITFSIIEPKKVEFKLVRKIHIKDVMGTGFAANVSILPKTVNFSALQFRELESYAKGTGILSDATGQPHGDYKNGGSQWLQCIYNEEKANYIGEDFVFGGRTDYPIPLPLPQNGTVTFFIYYEWKLGQQGNPKKINSTVIQTTTIQTNGYITTRKNDQSVTSYYRDPTVNQPDTNPPISPEPIPKDQWPKSK